MCAARLLTYGIYGVRGSVQYDRARSGLEWWAQCRRPEENEKNETIGFHWDKDEQLNTAVADLFVQPQFATVTYLTDCGAPTIVVPLRCAPLPCLVHSAAWWVRPPHPIISPLTMLCTRTNTRPHGVATGVPSDCNVEGVPGPATHISHPRVRSSHSLPPALPAV